MQKNNKKRNIQNVPLNFSFGGADSIIWKYFTSSLLPSNKYRHIKKKERIKSTKNNSSFPSYQSNIPDTYKIIPEA